MASFDLSLTLRTTDAIPALIRARTTDFEDLDARVLGDSENLQASLDGAAGQFTSILAWDISTLAAEDQQLWVDAAVALTYAADVSDMWADYVEEFRDGREELMEEWRSAVTDCEGRVPGEYASSHITLTFPERKGFWSDEDTCRDLYDELVEKRTSIQGRFDTLWTTYQEHAEEIGDMLEEGATKVNVQKLIDGGQANWAYYNLAPNRYTMLVDSRELTEENAQEWAGELAGYWSGDKPIDDRYHELMIMLGMITTNAMQAQQGGTGYREEEMDFLRTFYAELEDGNHSGVIGVPDQMELGEFAQDDREHALGILGDGLLALSDHRLGGGYYDLPESVQFAAEEGFLMPSGDGASGYGTNGLAELLRHASDDMEAGYGLSNTLTMSMGMFAASGAVEGMNHSEEDITALLDVSTRNRDANHDLLAGEYVHPLFADTEKVDGETTYPTLEANGFDTPQGMIDHVLEGLFTYDWDDDGESASGLFDWIAEDTMNGTPEEQERAGHAAEGFIETVTRPELFAALTGVEKADGGADIPMGEVNPDVALSMAEVFHAYVDDFGVGTQDSGGAEFHTDASPNQFAFAPDGNVLLVDDMNRVRFMELAMGDTDAASNMYASIEGRNAIVLNDALENGEFSEETVRSGGRLTYLFESAFDNYATGRYERGEDAYQQEIDIKKRGWGIVIGSAAGPIPYAGGLIGDGGKEIANHLIESNADIYSSLSEVESDISEEDIPQYSRDVLHFDIQLQLVNDMVDNGEIDPASLPGEILREDGSVARSYEEVDARGSSPSSFNELVADEVLDGESEKLAREYAEQFDDGNSSFEGGNLRADDTNEYNTHINPERRN
ncbi:hypothetical protein HNR06_001003 [Nocardiopsis arvandica]|uniref:TPR repeat domain-containing protein n=1 Tax=Nocardiopsis sinuspersici TaxID=501010 RepID=A0A7Y9X930_9ACTN|nr:hypothetical protein [Nocardiopsis sinuspersici]NYH51414.1 hypothetical protein [Nocardiopsis sinuspersici]